MLYTSQVLEPAGQQLQSKQQGRDVSLTLHLTLLSLGHRLVHANVCDQHPTLLLNTCELGSWPCHDAPDSSEYF